MISWCTLVDCFNGFFVQVTVDVNSILMDNIWLAAPLIIPQLHIVQVVLTDPQLLQVTAFVPGGDTTLMSSRSLTMTEKRNRVFTILDSTLRQRFTDMRNVGPIDGTLWTLDKNGAQTFHALVSCRPSLPITPAIPFPTL